MCQKYKDEFLYLDEKVVLNICLDYSLQVLDILILEVKILQLDNYTRITTPKTLQLKIGTKYSVTLFILWYSSISCRLHIIGNLICCLKPTGLLPKLGS